MELKDKKVVVIGGSSGIGFAIAKAALNESAHVIIASRSFEKLDSAFRELDRKVETKSIDLLDTQSISDFFKEIGKIDHLIISASSVKTGQIKSLPMIDAEGTMKSKFWGPYICAKLANISSHGSILLFSGVLSRRPSVGLAILGAVNAAVEGLGRGLALELSPTRVNVLSPGLTDTPAYDGMPSQMKDTFFKSSAKKIPVGRVGKSEEIAAAAIMLMKNDFITGITLDVDGGALLGEVLPH